MSKRLPAGRVLALLLTMQACRSQVDDPSEPVVFAVDAAGARVSACLGYSVGASVSFFGHPLLGAPAREVGDCVRQTSDCDGVLACLGYSAGPCAEGCEGSTAKHCRTLPNGLLVGWDEDCSRDLAGNHECKLIVDAGKGDFAGCFAGTTCEANSCEEGAAIYCEHGNSQRFACASNQTCSLLGEASDCMEEGDCDGDRCEGDQTLVKCNGGLVAFRVQCDDIVPGTVCQPFNASEAGCVAKTPHPTCPIEEAFANRCEGDVAIACMLGVRYELDCSLIDGHCDPANDSASCVVAD